MKEKPVLYEKKGKVAIVSLNRPQKLNAQNGELYRQFIKAMEDAEADPDVRVVILRGEGRAFCSGDDWDEEFHLDKEGVDYVELTQDTTRVMMRMTKPIIAAVQGYAVGSGCEWAMNCDIRIAAEGTKFACPETMIGGCMSNAGTKFLPLLVGMARAKEMVFTADFIDARKAEQWGLVSKVVPPEELDKAAMDMANQIAEHSPYSLKVAKRALHDAVNMDWERVLQQESKDVFYIDTRPETKVYIQRQIDRLKGRIPGKKT